jgi:hypothetical protein
MMLALGGVEKRAMTSWHVIAWRLQSAISDRRLEAKFADALLPSSIHQRARLPQLIIDHTINMPQSCKDIRTLSHTCDHVARLTGSRSRAGILSAEQRLHHGGAE